MQAANVKLNFTIMKTIKSYKVEMAIVVVLIILVAMVVILLPYSLNV